MNQDHILSLMRFVWYLLMMNALVFCSFSTAFGTEKGGLPAMSTEAVVRVADPRLKANMLDILNSLRGAPEYEGMALDTVEKSFKEQIPRLCSAETAKAIKAVQHYRATMEESHAIDVDGLLIALGETNAIIKTVEIMLTGRPMQKRKARLSITRSGQPKVIVALAPFLFLDEDVMPERRGEDSFVVRESVAATYMILDLVCRSDQFPAAVADWARQSRRLPIGKSRSAVREWWALNEKPMKEGRFGDTLPLPDHFMKDI